MENNAMFAAQQVPYGKVYGGLENCNRRTLTDELSNQGTINSRYEADDGI